MPAITPNYLTVDAAGNVNALFTGHVRASGIDLPLNIAGQSPPAPATQLLWSPGGIGDASATAPDGSIFAGQDAQGLVNLDVAMRGLATSQGRNARSGLQLNELTGGKAQVSVYAGPSGLALPLWSRKILDSDGNSDFESYGTAASLLPDYHKRWNAAVAQLGPAWSDPTLVACLAASGTGTGFVSFNWTPGVAGYYKCLWTHTGYTGVAGQAISRLVIGGVIQGYNQMYMNEISSHKTLPTIATDVGLRSTIVNVQLQIHSNLITDTQDIASIIFQRYA